LSSYASNNKELQTSVGSLAGIS